MITPNIRRTQAILIGSTLLSAAIVGAVVPSLRLSTEAALLLATAVILLIPMVSRWVKGTFDLFEPIVAFVVTYGILFVVRPAYMYVNDVDYFQITNEVAYIGDSLVAMQNAALVGALGFVLAYELSPGQRAASRVPAPLEPTSDRMALGGLVCFVLGLLGTFMFVSSIPGGLETILRGRTESLSTSLTATNGYLVFAPMLLVPASLLYVAAWLKERRLSYVVFAIISAVILIAVRGPVGGRIALLPLIGGLVIFLFLNKKSRPSFKAVVITLVIGMFLWTFVGQVRNESTRVSEGTGKIAQGILSEPMKMIDPITVGQDAGMAPGLAAGMSVVPDQIPYSYGLGIPVDFVVRGVPRSIWPEKPIPPREQFVSLVWSDGYSRNLANPEPSVLFSFYAEFGYLGILLGMALIGFLFRLTGEFMILNRNNILVLLMYAIYLASIPTIIRDSPPDSTVKIAFVLAPVVAVAWVGRKRTAQTGRYK